MKYNSGCVYSNCFIFLNLYFETFFNLPLKFTNPLLLVKLFTKLFFLNFSFKLIFKLTFSSFSKISALLNIFFLFGSFGLTIFSPVPNIPLEVSIQSGAEQLDKNNIINNLYNALFT